MSKKIRAELLESPPTEEQLEAELKISRKKGSFSRAVRNAVYVLLVVAAAAILIATVFFPVLQVTGNSMQPTMEPGEIVLASRTESPKTGDLIAFYYNNKVLLKRVIGGPGDIVMIDAGGNVAVNGVSLSEPYITQKSLGANDIEYPYQVPESRYFVMGDHRDTSIDSRTKDVGCIPQERIIGKVVLRVWPLARFGFI